MKLGRPLKLTVATPSGPAEILLELDPTKYTQRDMRNQMTAVGVYDRATTGVLLRVLRPGDTFVDVGAHIGVHSLLASRLVGESGAVVAIEGDEENFQHLRHHKTLNHAENITPIHCVVSDSPGTRTFWKNSDNDGGHTVYDAGAHPVNKLSRANPKPTEVQAETLDRLVQQYETASPKVIKVDAEGGDHDVLRGSSTLLDGRTTPFVVAEINEFGLSKLGSSQMRFREYMLGHGYATFVPRGDGSRPARIPDDYRIQTDEEFPVFNVLFACQEDVLTYWPEPPQGGPLAENQK